MNGNRRPVMSWNWRDLIAGAMLAITVASATTGAVSYFVGAQIQAAVAPIAQQAQINKVRVDGLEQDLHEHIAEDNQERLNRRR